MGAEFDFINWVRSQQPPSDAVPVPAGDDLAVLKWGEGLLLVGVDQVLDGVHFESAVHPPGLIGRKVINRNLSDCAAMACRPAAAVVTVALPQGAGAEYAKELYLGMKAAADVFGCAIVGGDTASWAGKLAVTVTILGRADGVQPITRAGARPGDGIFVTGPLGGSILGRHLTFEPRVALARDLARAVRVTAMIDLSDGLSRDLRHVCRASGVGAVIDAAAMPIHPDTAERFRRDSIDPLDQALHDGEDHELLFTTPDVPPDRLGARRIGRVVEGEGVILRTPRGDAPLEPRAWEHSL